MIPQNFKIIRVFEKVDFPEFDQKQVLAKVDTGAYTGALHCTSINLRDVEGGSILEFTPLGSAKKIKKDNFLVKHVKSSNGERQERYFITTPIVINGVSHEITLSLTSRSDMRFEVLVGRRFLRRNKYMISPSKKVLK